MTKPKSSEDRTRHIPAAIRDAVFERDGGRCAFVGANGKRCNSKWDLEIHHEGTPFGRGGGHDISNLKLLCSVHNRLEAEKAYGEACIKKHYIKEAAGVYLLADRHCPRLIIDSNIVPKDNSPSIIIDRRLSAC